MADPCLKPVDLYTVCALYHNILPPLKHSPTSSSQDGRVCRLQWMLHLEITLNYINNQPGEPSEDWMNRIPITKDIKLIPNGDW